MKTIVLNLGKALNKAEQKQINGGQSKACECDCTKYACDGIGVCCKD